MELEQIYESQLNQKPGDELLEAHKRVLGNINAVMVALMRPRMFYEGKQEDFYKNELQKLERFHDELQSLAESYQRTFIEYPFMNHPNRS